MPRENQGFREIVLRSTSMASKVVEMMEVSSSASSSKVQEMGRMICQLAASWCMSVDMLPLNPNSEH
jgi:hypothetical protein